MMCSSCISISIWDIDAEMGYGNGTSIWSSGISIWDMGYRFGHPEYQHGIYDIDMVILYIDMGWLVNLFAPPYQSGLHAKIVAEGGDDLNQ
jgi:hypothetical protein